MKNKKIISFLTLTLLSSLLFSCGGNSNSPSINTSLSASYVPSGSSSSSENNEVEISTININSGEYMYGDTLYEFDKENKKIIETQYLSYNDYKNHNGTKIYEKNVKYIQKDNVQYIFYSYNNFSYRISYKSDTTLTLEKSTLSSHTTTTLISTSNIVEPTLGNYVSTQFNQYKVDGEGNRVVESGIYVKEYFYVFVTLTETSVTVSVGETNTTPTKTLFTVSNYQLLLQNGYLIIKIPHVDGQYNCSLRISSASQIHITNSYEKDGDYSCSGMLTLVNNN